MGETSQSKVAGSLNLMNSLRQFRYVTRPLPKLSNNVSPGNDKPEEKTTVSGGTQTDNTSGFLKLNTNIFKRLHENSEIRGGAYQSQFKSKSDGTSSEDAIIEKNMKSLTYLKKIFSGIDEMEIQDALLQSKWNVTNAMLKLNEMIKDKINPKPALRPKTHETSSAVASSTSATSTGRVWKRIRLDPQATKNTECKAKTMSSTKASTSMQKTKLGGSVSYMDYYKPRSKRQSVIDFLLKAPYAELITVPGLKVKKAEIIVKVRPFSDWDSLCKKLEDNGIQGTDNVYESVAEVLRVRSEVSALMKTCSELSQKLALNLKQITYPGSSVSLSEQPALLTPGLRLAGYQMIGLNWLRLLHDQDVNGILADEMGLGKTIQVIAFLAYLKEQNLKEAVHLIVVPTSTLENWLNELNRWCPSLNVQTYYGSQEDRKAFRMWWRDERNKDEVQNIDIILVSYSTINSTGDDRNFFRKLDVHYVVYDEAHMLKNMTTQRYRSLMKIAAKHRILLTGTPLQNSLLELMSLLIFVMPNMFAEKQHDLTALFKTTKTGNDEQCAFEKEKISQAKKIMEPFVLRRLKKDVLGDLPPKTDHIEYCELTESQSECYAELLKEFKSTENLEEAQAVDEDSAHSENTFEVSEDIVSKDEESTKDEGVNIRDDPGEGLTGSMAMMMLLRRAANHTALVRRHFSESLIKTMAKKLKNDRLYKENNLENIEINLYNMSDHQLNKLCQTYKCISRFQMDDKFIFDSGKIKKLDEILPKLKSENHRVLLFSQFRQAIDILEDYVVARGYKFCRLDGTTPVSERQTIIDEFNTDDSIFLFLLTTKAGGCGINLASADTVILHDIDLNPYNDKQAEDRCHRVGQQRPVTIVRLISRGTIEEAMLKIANNKLTLEKQITHGTDAGNIQPDKKLLSLLKEALKAGDGNP